MDVGEEERTSQVEDGGVEGDSGEECDEGLTCVLGGLPFFLSGKIGNILFLVLIQK